MEMGKCGSGWKYLTSTPVTLDQLPTYVGIFKKNIFFLYSTIAKHIVSVSRNPQH